MSTKTKKEWPFGYSRWGDIEPWPWLHHFVPWWLLRRIHARYYLCWVGMASWKHYGEETNWMLHRSCITDPHGACYCRDIREAPQEYINAAHRAIDNQPYVTISLEDDT